MCHRNPDAALRRRDFEAVVGALAHRGPDGFRIAWRRAAALAHQHFWTTPEEVGEEQPVVAADGCEVALDGRLDNRRELLGALEVPASAWRTISDVHLAARARARWSEACFGRLLGPFCIAIYDPRRHRVVCGRDALGDRTLCYYWDGEILLAGSEEHALLRHPRVSSELDERTMARFFALRGPQPGATFFADLRELPPGHYLTLEDGRLELHRYWELDPKVRLRYPCDADYADHFRQLLVASVRCRTRSSAPPSVLMSGGLDSTSVAAVASSEPRIRANGRLRTISWVFDELAEEDERQYMDPVVEQCDLEAIRLPGDGAWPLRDLDTWMVNPNAPVRDLYRLRERAYESSRQAGCRVVLTGDFGDHLYYGYDFWLRDLLAEGRIADAARATWRFLTADPTATAVKLQRLRSALIRALGWRGRQARLPSWIPRAATELLRGGEPLPQAVAARRPDQYRVVLDPVNAHGANLEQSHANRMGVELRFPFRDRRLVQFVLSIPAHQIYRPGWFKWVLRQAMRGFLPESVRRRRSPTSLLTLCARGLVQRELDSVLALLARPDAIWPRYVRSDWLYRGFPSKLQARVLSLETVVAWRCVSMELWRERMESGSRHGDLPGVYNAACTG